MSGGFKVYGVQKSGNSEEMRAKFDEMNQYVVDTVGLEKPKTTIGVVSSIVDLGSQPLPDAEYELDKEDLDLSIDELNEKYEQEIAAGKFYFGDGYNGKTKQRELMKKVPQKPRQCVALAIDFPSKIVDKGQFFGEENSNPAPLRIWYGGKYWDGENMLIQNLTPLKERPLTDGGNDWSLSPKSILHKMAVASELIASDKEPFKSERIDELLGKAFLFSAQVGFEEGKGKNKGKKFYKEKVTFVGALMDGQEAPKLERTNLVMLPVENDIQAIKELPSHVKNTMARSVEFETSVLKAQLDSLNSDEDHSNEDSGVDSDDSADSKASKTNW